MKLLVDLGNSRLKWALWNGVDLEQAGVVAHADLTEFRQPWKNLPQVDSIWVASVGSAALNERVEHAAREQFHLPAHFVRSRAQACGVHSAYAQPERLGVDRFLGLIAAHAHAREPAVIVSCGTALTLDAIAADGTHLGGLIAASPDLALTALRGRTAQLAAAAAGHVVELADNTADAMESGAWLAVVALVERFVTQTTRRTGTTDLILTGGGVARLGQLLGLPHRIDGELVLRGLSQLADSGG